MASRRIGLAVADMAKRIGAEVVAIHVTRPSGQSRDEDHSEGERAVRTLADHIRVQDVAVQTLLLFADDVPRAILDTARERGATLIVLGLTGRSVLSRLIAGNVPVDLIRNTKIPVLLLPPGFEGVL